MIALFIVVEKLEIGKGVEYGEIIFLADEKEMS